MRSKAICYMRNFSLVLSIQTSQQRKLSAQFSTALELLNAIDINGILRIPSWGGVRLLAR